MIKINGNRMEYRCGLTVEMLLQELGYDRKRIAVELNGDILPKAAYADTKVMDSDSYEVVNFVGGG